MDRGVNPVAAALSGLAPTLTAAALAEALQGGSLGPATPPGALADGPGSELVQRLAAPAEHGLPQEAGHALAQGTAPMSIATGLDTAAAQAGAETTATPWQPSAASGLGELAAVPLAPVWVQALQAPPLSHQPWPARPDPHEEAQRRPRERPAWPANDPDPDAGTDADTDNDQPAPDDEVPPPRPDPGHPLATVLPPLIGTELQRRRAVLLWAPQAAGPGVQVWWLGFGVAAQPVCGRLAARGEGPGEAAWQWWLVRREGDDGCGSRPQVQPSAGSRAALALRVCPPAAAAPLREAGQAWLDLTDVQRLWRGLATQWTWLMAWSPRPLPWMR
jgi:hypothetical protein